MPASVDMRHVLGIILGGGRGSRLFPLTQYRSKPAVPIGGKYRLIDLPISNCLHSGVERIFILTQFNSASLNRHVSTTYRFDIFGDRYVEILAAEQTQESLNWYQGTADAVRKQLRHILSRRAEQCLILSGDHLYHMDYRPFVQHHLERNADVTIAVQPVRREKACGYGILKVDPRGRIVEFHEKPTTDAELDTLALPRAPGEDPEARYLASMGIYLFESPVLVSMLMSVKEDDFGRHIIPQAIRKVAVYAYPFEGYWEDIGTIRTFYEANLRLTDPHPPFDFHHPTLPVYTHPEFLAGAWLEGCRLERSIVAEGSRLAGAEVHRSVLGIRSIVGAETRLYDTVMMGADYYEAAADMARDAAHGIPPVGIGARSLVRGAIIDKNARIGEGVTIANERGLVEADGDGYYIRDGVVVVPKNAQIRPGTVI
ncbi:MAG: glucose-1-phosphate adenylyltransferase [Candidatus Latescibacterota bacterium]